MDPDMLNLAQFIVSELQAMMIPGKQLYQTGNMQRATAVASVGEDYIDIVISTDYASYTNVRGRMAGWIERTVDRACRCYSENNNVDNASFNGTIFAGGDEE